MYRPIFHTVNKNMIIFFLAESCVEHLITNTDLTGLRIESLNFDGPDLKKDTIFYINQLDVPKEFSSHKSKEKNDVASSVVTSTDLVSGVYEGGFKIWECSYDVLSYLSEPEQLISLKSINVLDLGCGSGLLGIYCALHGARQVNFQDYNAEVIKGVTIPNYVANIQKRKDIKCSPFFFSGSWDTFSKPSSIHEKLYDLIITSETIYNTEHYSTLLEIFDTYLATEGRVLLAAKVNYFGVGGGLRHFEKALNDNTPMHDKWSYCTVKVMDNNVKREIIEIKRNTYILHFRHIF